MLSSFLGLFPGPVPVTDTIHAIRVPPLSVIHMSRGNPATLDGRVHDLKGQALAPSTRRTYLTYLCMYLKLCGIFKVQPVPISYTHLGRYIAYLSYRLKVHSIRNYLSVVPWLHLEAGKPNPIDCHYASSIVKGAKRTLGDTVSQKLPITPIIVLGILKNISLKSPKDITFWTACLVAFFSFFRKCNLLAPSL